VARYDELTIEEISTALAQADNDRAKAARDSGRAHKNRAGGLATASAELSRLDRNRGRLLTD
jgi:hypothetical protein